MASHPKVNQAITAKQLRVIGPEGQQLGVLERSEALAAAAAAELDLVEVSSASDPPVARVIDWGKYNYQRTKQLQKSRKNSKNLDVKQIRVGLKIGEHDLDIKLRRAAKFMEAGHKVKVAIIYRGRELAHKELGFKLADRVTSLLGEDYVVDQPPQFAGRQLTFIIRKK